MRLATLREFAEVAYTPTSRPSMDRLYRLADAGEIRGATRQGKRWFVDMDQFQHDDADALVKKILCS